jgi:hypothetical protein
MTPEKIAKNLVFSRREAHWFKGARVGDSMGNTELMISDISAAIREAIEEERKECIKALNSLLAQCEGNETGIGCLMAACRELKARQEPQKKGKAA